jgi:hypothetical protein
MFNFNQKEATDWRGMLANIKAMREKVREYSANVPGLAPVLNRELQAERDKVYGTVVSGAIGEFRAAIQNHFDAARKVDIYKQAEGARWNLVQVEQEKGAILSRIRDIAQRGNMTGKEDKVDELHNLFSEAMSGSPERRRATLEVFERIQEMNLPGQTMQGFPLSHSLGEFVVDARQKLAELRTTPDLVKAQQDQEAALNDVMQKRQQLFTTGDGLGEPVNLAFPTNALSKAARQVRSIQNNSGSYDIYIYPENDPEVTGVDMSKLYQTLEAPK